LSRETDTSNCIAGEASGLQSFANGKSGGAPPIARILLGPAGLRAGKVSVFFSSRSEDRAMAVENDGARAAGADVYS